MPSPSQHPPLPPFSDFDVVKGQALAWEACFHALFPHGPSQHPFRHPENLNGMQTAVAEIRRLQQCAGELAELSLAKGKADDALAQPPSAEPTRANAGPEPGDMLIDRFIASVPLPMYDLQEQPAGELPGLPAPTIEGTVMHPELKICYSAPVHFDADQMREYGHLCRAAGIEDADKRDAALPVAVDYVDQSGFETWSKREGVNIMLAIDMQCEDGRFPATYHCAPTETAWRAWANKPTPPAAPVALSDAKPEILDDLGNTWRHGLREEDSKCDEHPHSRNIVTISGVGADQILVKNTSTECHYIRGHNDTVLKPVFPVISAADKEQQ